jgi:hypothetical protein
MASYYTDEGFGQTMQGRLLDSLTHSQDPSQRVFCCCRESSIAVLAFARGFGFVMVPVINTMNLSIRHFLVVSLSLLTVTVTKKSCEGFLQCIQPGFCVSQQKFGSQCVLFEQPFKPVATEAAGAGQDELKDSAVDIQKKRALELWSSVRDVVEVDDQVSNLVSSKLDNGLVPPVFHAYVALSQRVRAAENAKKSTEVSMYSATQFRANTQNLQSHPSANKVTAGEPGNNTLKAGKVNVDDFFYSDKKARSEVRDVSLKGIWVFSKEWTEKVCRLLNSDAEMVGADVEATKVDSDFELGAVEDMSDSYLITRRLSRGVVAECLTMPATGTRAIVGNPGIGKSWTLIYALQQLLLRNDACVLFFSAKPGVALALI